MGHHEQSMNRRRGCRGAGGSAANHAHDPGRPAPGPGPHPDSDSGAGDLHAQNPWDGGVVDRRVIPNRRDVESETGLERRRGAGRRLSDFQKSAEEGEMNKEQFMFLMAIDAFKKGNARQFPTWTDVLEVIRLLGYRKTMPSELNLANAEDWNEQADAPANVRAARWHQRAAIDKSRREKPAA